MMSSEDMFLILLDQLGVTPHEFVVAERARFELSPSTWFEERLKALGYTRRGKVGR